MCCDCDIAWAAGFPIRAALQAVETAFFALPVQTEVRHGI
jgi:hypothetical protein